MTIFEQLTNNIILHPDQGYAFYYYNNKEEIEEVNGKETLEGSNNISFNSNFRLASVTKQFIAFGIVRLINQGLLSYDTKVKELYPELPDYFNKITIKNLLNHTSGLYNYEDIPHNEDDQQIQDNDIIPFLKATKGTYFEPGTVYRYSNTAYVLLGVIITKVTGLSLGEFYDAIFKEAGMVNSIVNYQGKTKVLNRAYGHLIDEENNLYVKDQYWCSATIGDGGLYSCINDLKKWCKYLNNSKEFESMRIPNPLKPDDFSTYGFGIRVVDIDGKKLYYHCGSTIGTSTLLVFSEDFDVCLIFLSNLGNVNTSGIKDNLLKLLNNK